MIDYRCQYENLIPFLAIRDSKLMAVVSVFFDESGKFRDKKVISLCGLFATESAIGRFQEKWGELLRRSNLPFLKASQALRAHRELSNIIPRQSVENRIEALKPFAACI